MRQLIITTQKGMELSKPTRFHVMQHIHDNDRGDVLIETHNAGLFSNFTIALQSCMMFVNEYHKMPDVFDRSFQFLYYKEKPEENLVPMLFNEQPSPIEFTGRYDMSDDPREQQFGDYRLIRHADLKPFIDRYFTPSELILNRVREFEQRYQIDYENTIGVFHRSNDKIRETGLATDEQVIEKAKEFKGRYFVVPDHWQFLDAFQRELPNSFYITGNRIMDKDETKSVFMILNPKDRPEHAINFFATVIMLSKCKELVGHSGNGNFWAVVYRGHSKGVHQFLNDRWI